MDKTKEEKVKTEKTKVEKITYYEAVGRRKTSTARARLYVVKDESMQLDGKDVKKGEMVVNSRPVENYFPGEVLKKMYTEPFRTTNTVGRFVISLKTNGGGLYSQLGAVIHAVSRALEKVDKEKFRPILKKRGFMTRDPRAKERRKAGFAQKARARKQSPKR
jgi:small subunit ribosomal protein S9